MPKEPPAPPSPVPLLALAICLGVMAVLACAIPFVPPLVIIAVPLAGAALALTGWVVVRGTRWTLIRLVCALTAFALTGLALYPAVGRHHLIDWLEGH